MNLMQTGAAWLCDQLQTHAARSITIIQEQRPVLSVTGWCVRKDYVVSDNDGLTRTIDCYDWQFKASDLPFMYSFKEGAILKETLSGLSNEDQVYEVVSIGKQGYSERFDDAGVIVAVHTQLISVLENVPAIYYPPGNAKAISISQVALTTPENTESFNSETGEIVRHIRCVASIDAKIMESAGVTGFQYGSQVEVSGNRWHVDMQNTRWGSLNVRLGLVRKPLIRKQEARRASV